MKTCYIYIRTASQHPLGDKTFNSIEIQKGQCLEYARTHKYQVLGVFHDNGVSGNTLKRKGLQQLLVELENHAVNAVIVSRLDRFSRKIKLFSYLCKIIAEMGVKIISVTEGIFGFNSLIQNIIISIAEYDNAKKDDK